MHATHIDDDEEFFSKIATRVAELLGRPVTSENTGGWVYCVLIADEKTGGTWYWGTANECWGASLMTDDGENLDNRNTDVPSDCVDVERIAQAIAGAHTPKGIVVVYTHANGFVTDTGGPATVTDSVTGAPITTLPRYGVWKEIGMGKLEVVFTTDDLAEAKLKAEL